MQKIIFTLLAFLILDTQVQARAADSVLDRVEKTKTLRCGYMVYEPYIKKDPNTGKMSGITVDYLEKVAAKKGLKINWVSEINPDQTLPIINNNRVDMVCVPFSPIPSYEKVLDFKGSFGTLPYYIYVPQKSTLTMDQLKTAKFVAVDGYIPSLSTNEIFPQAKLTTLPQTTSQAELFDQLKYNKVDALFNEHISASNYMRNNPHVIRRFSDTPSFLKVMSFPVKKGDKPWGDFINAMTDTSQGENKAIFLDLIKKYGVGEDALRPSAAR